MPQGISNFMVYAGAHFKTCPIELREAWSLVSNAHIVSECLHAVTEQTLEFVNLGTCNRFDLCIFGKLTKSQIYQLFDLIAQRYFDKQNLESPISFEQIKSVIHIDFDKEALTRLFKVTASLDSLVLGEQQILGQVKAAYVHCAQLGHARAMAHQVFSHNFKVAKKIRHSTQLGRNSVSIGHAAIVMSLQIFQSLSDKKIIIIGAGEMAKIVAKNILQHKPHSLSIANRTYDRAQRLCHELKLNAPLEFEDALANIHLFDVCVVAVKGTHFLLTTSRMKHYEKLRQGNLSVFIDISVPRKIDPKVNEMDNVFLFHVDDLDLVMEQNRALRQDAAKQAILIIDKEVQSYLDICEQKENLKSIAKIHQWMTSTIHYEVERYLYDVARGRSTNIQNIGDAVAKKIISHSAHLARHNEKLSDSPYCVSEMLEFLFDLSAQKKRKFEKNSSLENVIPLKRKNELS